LITLAPWSTAHRIPATSAASDDEAGVEGETGDADAVRGIGGDLAGDERAVPLVVAVRGAADERARGDDAAHEVRVRPVEAGVDDPDLDRVELGEGVPVVPRVVLLEVPLLRGERLGVREGGGDRRDGEQRERGEREEASHRSAKGAETPATTPWPGAARTR
jgi:hypothetical protein